MTKLFGVRLNEIHRNKVSEIEKYLREKGDVWELHRKSKLRYYKWTASVQDILLYALMEFKVPDQNVNIGDREVNKVAADKS